MALKKATVSFTKPNGELVTREISIKKVVFHYDEMAIEPIYEMYPNALAKERGAQAELHSQRVNVDLKNQADSDLVLSASARIWEKNLDAPFITDYSELDENGRIKPVIKSLAELGAIVEEALK